MGLWRPLVEVEGCEKILPEFQERRLGGWVNAAESARTTYGVCTLT
jgi:hypothetical protein